MKSLNARILDADVRCNKWLADGNEAHEAGKTARADLCYDRSQYWLDRRIALEERRYRLALTKGDDRG